MAELTATQRPNIPARLLGQFVDLLRSEAAQPEFLPFQPMTALMPLESMEKLSYGDPLFRMPQQSNIPMTVDRQYLIDALGLASMAPSASRATTKLSNEAADRLVRMITRNPEATAPQVLEAAGQMLPLSSIYRRSTPPSPDPSIRLSKAENEALGLYHPIGGGLKLQRPISEMSAIVEPSPRLPLVEREVFPLEGLLGGRLIPFSGDRAAAGQVLRGVNDLEFERPVLLEGGPDFMRMQRFDNPEESAAWASGKGVIANLSRRAAKAGEEGDVYGVYTAMSPTGVDYNTMLMDTVLNQLPSAKITKKLKKEFDREIQKVAPDFVGVDSPDLERQLLNDPPLRTLFVQEMDKGKWRRGGFPDIAASRKAITEPELLDVPVGSTGYTIARLDPLGRVVENPRIPHKTYDTQLMGQYVGGLEQQIPREVMFSDFYAQRRARGMPESGDDYAFKRADVMQEATPQWLDSVMNYLRSVQR